jgi:hypothetical protein
VTLKCSLCGIKEQTPSLASCRRASTKLFILCRVFVGSIMLATYSLIDEKQIAISFVRKELVGAQYLEALRRESFLHKKWRHPCCHLRRT